MTDFDHLNDRYPVSEILARYGIQVRNGAFKCPLHDDHTESGSVYTGKDRRERWRCHVCDKGGDSLDFIQAYKGLDRRAAIEEMTGEVPPRPGPRPRPGKKPELKIVRDLIPFPRDKLIRPGLTPEILHKSGKRRSYTAEMVHRYGNERGEIILLALRIKKADGSKLFVQVRYDRHEGYMAIGWEHDEPLLYRQPQLGVHPDKPVLVVEGEKCVDAVKDLVPFDDYVVISWQGGAQALKKQPWGRLQGRRVVLWPDNDEPGRKAMQAIARAIQPAEVRIVEPLAEWPDKFDIFDLLQTMPADEARQLMENLAGPFEGAPPPGPDPTDRDGEPIRYLLNAEGGIAKGEVTNWSLFVERDERFGRQLAYDVFDKVVLVDGEPLDDLGVDHLAHHMGLTMGFRALNPLKIAEILTRVARRNPVNRLADELRAIAWDGVERHLTDYAGAELSTWAHTAGWVWLLGLARRILEPGCKHDLVLVLQGRQGMGKSRFFETMGLVCGRNLYTDLARLTQDKDVQMKLAGKAIVELSEMTAHRAGESDALKGMITSPVDHYRPPYGRRIEEVPRTCVFGGSTNERQYLKDMTGNRRYLIVEVTRPADIEQLRRDLPQLLAEAVAALTMGERNWLDPEEEKLQGIAAGKAELDWPQFYHLEEVLKGEPRTELSRAQIWELSAISDHVRRTQQLDRALEYVMERCGWEYHRTTKARVFRRKPGPKLDDSAV